MLATPSALGECRFTEGKSRDPRRLLAQPRDPRSYRLRLWAATCAAVLCDPRPGNTSVQAPYQLRANCVLRTQGPVRTGGCERASGTRVAPNAFQRCRSLVWVNLFARPGAFTPLCKHPTVDKTKRMLLSPSQGVTKEDTLVAKQNLTVARVVQVSRGRGSQITATRAGSAVLRKSVVVWVYDVGV